jgi:hypothetical protein
MYDSTLIDRKIASILHDFYIRRPTLWLFGVVQKEFIWTTPDFLMNKPLSNTQKANFYAVFGTLACQKLHNINPLVPSTD